MGPRKETIQVIQIEYYDYDGSPYQKEPQKAYLAALYHVNSNNKLSV